MTYIDGKITPEDERRRVAAVDRIVDTIIDLGIEDYADVLLEMYGRYEVLGQMSYMSFSPIAAALWGREGLDIAEVLALNPREGVDLILKRLKEVRAERERQKLYSEEVEPAKKEEDSTSLWTKIKAWFSHILGRKN